MGTAIELVTSEPLLGKVRELFREYQISLGIDLAFQDFEEELATLPGKYAPPDGRLYVASVDEAPAGCIALRPLQRRQCEMKRLYVRPVFRGRDFGRRLALKVIAEAREIGYAEMYLDTLSTMTSAQRLYQSLGFTQVPPYRFNPIEGTQFMKLDLQRHGAAGRPAAD